MCCICILNLYRLCVVPSVTAASSTKPTGATRTSRRTSSSSAVQLTPQLQQLTPQSTPIMPLPSNTEGLQPSQELSKRQKTAASVGKPSGSSHGNEGQERQTLKGSVQEGDRQLPGVRHTEDTAARTAEGHQKESQVSVAEDHGQSLVPKAQEDESASAGMEDGFAVTCTCVVLVLWTARYNTWLLIKLTPKDIVFSFLFFSFLLFSFLFFSFLFFYFLFFSFLFFSFLFFSFLFFSFLFFCLCSWPAIRVVSYDLRVSSRCNDA